MSDQEPQPAVNNQNPNQKEVFGYNYEQACKVRKYSVYAGSAMIIFQSIMKIISLGAADDSFRTILTGIYFTAIAIVLVLMELEKSSVIQWFMFLNFGLGKVFLYVFMISTMLSFSETAVWDILVAIVFFISVIFNIILHVKFKDEEMDRIEAAMKRLEEKLKQDELANKAKEPPAANQGA